ncbi:MAG: winged helix-turn-helix domain-containing protein [Anaerolineales bacterium]|nr:winged helix-turn-helix domain-containing protein [Anaerolineales bacterium]
MSRLDLYLFGAFEVARNGRLLTASDWRSQQNRTILKVLAAHDGQVVTSEQLLDVLWPGDASPAARRRLHVRISQLRALLADGGAAPAVETVKGGYRFSRENGSWLDVAAFEALARQGSAALEARALETAVAAFESARALYRDDFLVEDLYESWTVARREQLREQHLTLLVELAESYAQQGRFRQAIACCHDALTADAYREPVYVRLMLYHYYAGEQAQALRIFARCRDLLQRELAVAPLPATVALMAQIRDGTLWAQADAPRYPPPAYSGRLFAVPYSLGNPPLVGRAREYAWLVERWRDPAARVVLVEGEAGIGKTRLVQALLGYAQAGGVAARQLRVDPAGEPPHAALLALADGGGVH